LRRLAIGAEALITGGSGLASVFGVSDAVIALTVTSIGTGLPEIVATVLAVARREVEMAIANLAFVWPVSWFAPSWAGSLEPAIVAQSSRPTGGLS